MNRCICDADCKPRVYLLCFLLILFLHLLRPSAVCWRLRRRRICSLCGHGHHQLLPTPVYIILLCNVQETHHKGPWPRPQRSCRDEGREHSDGGRGAREAEPRIVNVGQWQHWSLREDGKWKSFAITANVRCMQRLCSTFSSSCTFNCI